MMIVYMLVVFAVGFAVGWFCHHATTQQRDVKGRFTKHED
jgi:hypothetical protein